MDPLVRGALFVRGAVRRGHGVVIAAILGAYVVDGGAFAAVGPGPIVALAVWAVLLATRLRDELVVTAFALLTLAFLRAEVARIRASARARLDAEIVRLKEDARSYRLLGAGEAPAAEPEEPSRDEARADRLARSSVEEIHLSVHYA